MKIYIDESWDFNENSEFINLYASIWILSSKDKLLRKEKQFLDRKKSYKIIWEVKWKKLILPQIESFISNVVLQEPKIFLNIQIIIPNQNPIKKRHEIFVNLFKEQINNHIWENNNAKSFYLNLYNWFNNLSLQLFIKIELLTTILYDIFLDFYIFSTLHFEDELSDIEIFIDEDRWISKQWWSSRSKFQQYFKNILRQSSYKKPFPLIKEWTNEHPFRKRFIDEKWKFMISKIFYDYTNFYKSEDILWIQMADIVASIFYKLLNNKIEWYKKEELLNLLAEVRVWESHEFNLSAKKSEISVPNLPWIK